MKRTLLVGALCMVGCGLPWPWRRDEPKQVARKPAAVQVLETALDRAAFQALAAGPVPQAPGARALYDAAEGARVGPLHDGLLVCEARVHGAGYDDGLFAGGADVFLRLTIGDGETRFTQQNGLRMYTFPVASLAPGDRLDVSVIDDDVFFDDTIGVGGAPYTGGETRVDTPPGAVVTCRPAAAGAVRAGRRQALAQLDRALDRRARVRPDLRAVDLGYPAQLNGEVVAAARGVLAYGTLAHPGLAARVERAIAIDAGWADAVREAIDAEVRSLPGPGSPTAAPEVGSLTVDRVACGAEATAARDGIDVVPVRNSGCVVELTLRADRELRLAPAGWSVEGIAARGELSVGAVEAVAEGEGAWRSIADGSRADGSPAGVVHLVPAGGSVRLALGLASGPRARLLRLGVRGAPVLLRLP